VDRGELKASEKKPILTTDGQLLGIPPILYLIMFLWTFIVRPFNDFNRTNVKEK
jgi:hypothetical protein